MAKRVTEHLVREEGFGNFFGKDVWVVPVPGSTKRVQGGLWVPLRICEEISAQGLCAGILQIVKRETSIRSSRFSTTQGNRPTVAEHLETLKIEEDERRFDVNKVLLVDDVITKGSTIIACALKVLELYPDCEIRAFAAARTLGFVESIETIRDPYEGVIRFDGDEAHRG